MKEQWNGFNEGAWTKEINVEDFIKRKRGFNFKLKYESLNLFVYLFI